MNKFLIIAALTKNPETRTAGDTPVINLNLSGERRITDKDGKARNLRFFTQAEGLGKTAEMLIERGYQQGDVLLVEGSGDYTQWDDKDSGEKRSNVKLKITGAVRKLSGIPTHTDAGGNVYALGGKNCLTLIGNLAADVDVRKTQAGDSFTTIRLAVNEKFTRRDGSKSEKVHWFSVELWREHADMLAGMKKGQSVYVEGALVDDTYTDKNNVERRVKVVQASDVYPIVYTGDAPQKPSAPQADEHPEGMGSDDLPF